MDPAVEPSPSATDLPIHVRVWGDGPRVVLVHGAMTDGERTWEKQRPLSARWTLVVPDRRGWGESPAVASSDFEVDAGDIDELLGDGAHLVGHSYGGVVALFAAARRPAAVHSLIVIEPPAYAALRGDPEVEAEIADFFAFRAAAQDPEERFRSMLERLGAPTDNVPHPLPPRLERDVILLSHERPPWDAALPTVQLREAGIPVLVVTGGHNPVFERICDALAAALAPGATRLVLTGRGHAVQRTPELNAHLESFWTLARRTPSC